MIDAAEVAYEPCASVICTTVPSFVCRLKGLNFL